MPKKYFKIFLFLVIFLIFSISIFFVWLGLSAEKNFEIDFLDVGQGDSILIKTRLGQNILVDGGSDSKVIEELGSSLPWWDRTIDLMILTHPHSDHVAGLIDVLNRYEVKKVLYTGVVHTAPEYLEWLRVIRDKDIEMKIISNPQKVILDEISYLDILYPTESLLNEKVGNLNNSSMVIKLVDGENKILLAGDLEEDAEEELLYNGLDLKADILKANHHGSSVSNTEEFLKTVNPEIVVISVGADNKFGHPGKRILNRLERMNLKIYRTDENGTVKIESNGKEFFVK